MWGMPCYGNIHPKVYQTHLMAIARVARMGIKVVPNYFVVTNKMGLVSAENLIVKAALAANCDYLFMTEMDMLLPPDTLCKLYDLGKDFAAGLYFLRGTKARPEACAYIKAQGDEAADYGFIPIMGLPSDGRAIRVDAAGMGCVLMKTSALKALKQPWFDEGLGGFDDKETGRKKRCGSDMYFWAQVFKQGAGQLWLDSSLRCGQINEASPEEVDWSDYEAAIKLGRHDARGFLFGNEGTPAYGAVDLRKD